MRIKFNVSINPKNAVRGRQDLQVEGEIERDPKFLPGAGSIIRIVFGKPGAPRNLCVFYVQSDLHDWGTIGDSYELSAYASFEDIVRLALVEEWRVVDGIDELSKDQQDMVRCREGTCGDKGHSYHDGNKVRVT